MKHILVATDHTPAADRALTLACTLGLHHGAAVTVIHCVLEKGRDFSDSYGRLEALRLRFARARGIEIHVATVIGKPAERLAKAAVERKADLLVAATSSKSKLQKFLIGSTAKQLLHVSDVPVLIIPPGMRPEIRSIVVGANYTDQCAAALLGADSIGASFNGAIEVVHVSSEPGQITIEGGAAGIHSKRHETLRLEAWCAQTLPDPRCKLVAQHLVSDSPGEQLSNHVRDVGADLIAVGSHDRGLLARLQHPHTGDFILENAGCGLLSVR